MKKANPKIPHPAVAAKKILVEVLRYLFFILFLAGLISLVYFVRHLKEI